MGSERSKSALNCHGQPKHFPPMISNSSNIWTVRASNLIHSGMFDVVENEAQLAAVADRLSRNVANAVLSASGRRSHGIPNVDRGRPGHFSEANPNWEATTIWTTAIMTALLFFAAIILHELSHAAIARLRGLPV